MTEFEKGRFSVAFMGNKQYRDNWDAIFGKKEEPPVEELTPNEAMAELTRLTEEMGGYESERKAEPFVPAGHRRLPGGGIRKPRGQ